MSKIVDNSLATYTYEGIAYRQSTDPNSPLLISFVASAEELLEWAGIPRRGKLEQGQIGFQRTEDETRVSKAKNFFQKYSMNQSPTAIVIGIHQTLNSIDGSASYEILENSSADVAQKCRLKIQLPEEVLNSFENEGNLELNRMIALVKGKIVYRVTEEENNPTEEILDDSFVEESSNLSQDIIDYGDDEQTQLELGESLLKRFLSNLDNPEWCKANVDTIRDFAKPATIIDGQHRLLGAAACERNIHFTVCALMDCPWSEQVFQFTVINYTAKGIPDQFITANAALSLTESELEMLKRRFDQAGVRVKEYELMEIVQFNEGSPFRNLINLSEKSDPTKIGYKTMVRVARRWYDAKPQGLQLVLSNLYSDIQGKSPKAKRERLEKWKSQDWGDFFLDFWKIVYDRYKDCPSHEEGHTLWEVNYSNFIIAIVLFEFQEIFFEFSLNSMESEDFEGENTEGIRRKLKLKTERFVERMPPEFFGMRWQAKGLNSESGRKMLRETLIDIFSSRGDRSLFDYRKSNLITG